jgi:hypothetical protein
VTILRLITFVRGTRMGDLKPVKFFSYLWKRIDGFILDFVKEELARERRQVSLDK